MRPKSRQGKSYITVCADPDFVLAFKEIVARVARKEGRRITEQEAVIESIRLYFLKHGAKPPDLSRR
jgi:hypothetical protein